MQRHCDGTDPNLIDRAGQPCRCLARFDDVRFSVIWPHDRILTPQQRARVVVSNADPILAALRETYPGIDWDRWMAEQRTLAGGL